MTLSHTLKNTRKIKSICSEAVLNDNIWSTLRGREKKNKRKKGKKEKIRCELKKKDIK